MSKIRVRLLGGFEVWAGERQIAGFESQKVRALLAYLICNRRRAFSRDHLAGMLWPERDGDAARHALRQAVYNLRSKLPDGGDALLQVTNAEIGLVPRADLWLDVEAFEEALRLGSGRTIDPQHLAAAVQLYRGEFMAGFFVKDSPDFEDWMVAEQVRLRDATVEALHHLIESYSRRGEYRFGAHYARRLVAIEPLLEEAHRELMRLWALDGQRSRVLTQYEELSRLLREELGVEPLKETRQLYQSILSEAATEEAVADPEEPVGPIVPLVGRAGAYARLQEDWSHLLAGKSHLTLVTGERGMGKTRLIQTFLDVTTSKGGCGVLKGRCYELSPLQAYQPFVEIFRGALAEAAEGSGEVLAQVPQEVLEDLARLVPELRDLRPDLPQRAPLTGSAGRQRLFASVGLFLEGLCRSGDPLIVFVDDLHFADRDTLDLLELLLSKLVGPIWIVAALRPDEEMEDDHPLSRILRHCEQKGSLTRLELEPLKGPMLEEIAESLVGEGQVAELAGFLAEKAAGLPLAVDELVNYLWGEGILVTQGAGRWKLGRALREVQVPEDLEEVIRLRVRRLPNSTRRLASLAAVLGQVFEAQLLQEAADEHVKVVEIGLEILLNRWLIRRFTYFWTTDQGDAKPLVPGAQGVRRGSFEFTHNRTRKAIYGEINPLRRQAMHAQVAAVVEKLRGDRDCETLAYHYTAANQWEKALPYLRRSFERALALCADDAARRYCDQAMAGLSRLAAGARSEAAAERWREEREKLREQAATLSF